MPSITIDTNIYVSALIFGGTPMRLLHLAIDGKLDVAVSQPILDETARVLEKKFFWPTERIEQAIAMIMSLPMWLCPRRRSR